MTKDIHGSKPLQRVALELGYISIYWAWLEDAIDALITELAPLEEGHAANAIMGSTDIRQKVQMLKALAFIRRGKSDGWYEAVIANLNFIDNDLRGRRNAFVHAPWFVPKGKLVRHKKSTKIAKAQAFQPPVLTTLEITPVKIAEARKLKADMLKALRSIVHQLAFAKDFGWYIDKRISFQEGADMQESMMAAHAKRRAAARRRQRKKILS